MLIQIIEIIGFIIILLLIVSLFSFYTSTHPKRTVTPTTPADFNSSYKDVSFKTSDNLTLKGWLIPGDKKRVVIVTHGYPFDKGNILPSTIYLHERFSLLYFDFRAMGESEGKTTSVGFHERKDINAAVDFLRAQGYSTIGVMAHSMGAATTLCVENDHIKAIVSDSAYKDIRSMIEIMYQQFSILKSPFIWLTERYASVFLNADIPSLSPQHCIKNLNMPILLIHGDKDSQVPVSHAYALHEANPDTELWIVKGADHVLAHNRVKDIYEKRVISFFDTHLR